jgi:hypothetical protein
MGVFNVLFVYKNKTYIYHICLNASVDLKIVNSVLLIELSTSEWSFF